MRKVAILLAVVALAVGLIGVAPASAKTTKPVTLDGKVNAKGTKDLSGKATASLEVEADDYYFSPTFVKVQPGEKVTITLKNEGNTTHTFTSTGLDVDKQVSAGQVGQVHRDRAEQWHGVPVPLRLPREHGHAGRVLHQVWRQGVVSGVTGAGSRVRRSPPSDARGRDSGRGCCACCRRRSARR